MAQITVKLRYLRHATRKVRLVADTIRGKNVTTALDQLAVMPQRAAKPLEKLLESAVSALKAQNADTTSLVVREVLCDQGPAYKRRQLNSRGRASMIKKLTTHVKMTVTEVVAKKATPSKK